MSSSDFTYDLSAKRKPSVVREGELEAAFIEKLRSLKYTVRTDIRDRAALEKNFREMFEELNRVHLTDGEFSRLLDEIITSDVFAASRTLRERNTFTRDDGTPLNYTLVNINDWCKNTYEVINQLRINTDYSHHRYDVILLINGVPVVQIELKTLGISPRRAMEQIVEYKNDPGNGYTKTLLCFLQLFVVSNRSDTWYFANNNSRHFAFNADERPAKKPAFDAIVANPPFSYRWEPTDAIAGDVRFKNHGLAPKSAADFAFLLHGFHFLKDEGVMAIISPHGVLFRGGAEERIRTKLLKDGHIDTVIGLPANLFCSTGIPVRILVLKKCKKPNDVLFINAAEHFVKGKRQNQLTKEHIAKIIDTSQYRKEEERYSKRIGMERIAEEGYNLNISRYISTAMTEEEIDLDATHRVLVEVESAVQTATDQHNKFLKELGLPLLPTSSDLRKSEKVREQ